MNLENILVGLIVIGAGAWALRAVTRSWRGKSKCGCGNGHCPAAMEASDRVLRTIEPTETEKQNAPE